jgi:hypothetical protein
MLEPWRSQYLQAMGVEIYLPRRELPAAAPSPEWEWDESAYQILTTAPSNAMVSIALSDSITDVAPAQRRNPVAPVMPAVDSPAVNRQRTPGPAPAKTAAAPTLQIKLQIALSESGVLIIDDLPAQPRLRNEMQRLWGNLLFALQKKPTTLQLEQFDWPLSNLRNKQIELNETAARETLAGFLSKKIQSGNVQTIILLGENAQHWISQSQFQHLAGEHPLCWLSSIGTPSILSDPRRKQQWWLDLRQFALPH